MSAPSRLPTPEPEWDSPTNTAIRFHVGLTYLNEKIAERVIEARKLGPSQQSRVLVNQASARRHFNSLPLAKKSIARVNRRLELKSQTEPAV